MTIRVVVGGQWGDEGKGKVIDCLSPGMDVVVRSQGGANAGHTVVFEGKKQVLHLIPSGILHDGVLNVIGNGVVLDPEQILGEIAEVNEHRQITDNLKMSDAAHVVMPYHKRFDRLHEHMAGRNKIGTTGRGIGPCYSDKIARRGIRLGDILDQGRFRDRLELVLPFVNRQLVDIFKEPAESVDGILELYKPWAEQLAPYVCDTVSLLHSLLEQKKNILFEGAQGTLLDIDFGTYPFVTSSNCFSGGMMSGSGVPPTCIDEIVGIFKAYCTRVGAGPFTSELTDEVGEELRKKGSEFGATTGRPRRCGWFDVVAGRFSARINGLTEIVMTKLDILTGFDEIPVCIAYDCDGERLDTVPSSLAILKKCKPVYESVPGWQEDISNVRKFEDLPANAQAYVQHIEKLVGVHIAIVSVGPDREAIIKR